jgi:large subunit ribosomal protein L25
MEEVVLKATKRDVIGKHVKVMRREGKLPAIIYGRGVEPTPIILDLRESTRTLVGLPKSALVTIDLDGQRHMALVREKQRDYIRGTLKHIDFQAVSAKEKIRVAVGIVLQGEAPAVDTFNGILVTSTEQVMVECFPQDLINEITVDISGLAEIGDAIYVRDLNIPPAIELLTDLGDLVVVVTAQAAEEVEEAEEEVAEGEEPERVERRKEEGSEEE